jgi:hypothetical protein
VNERPDDATGEVTNPYGDEQPGDVMVFLAVLVVGIVVLVALLYGFFWLMYSWPGG